MVAMAIRWFNGCRGVVLYATGAGAARAGMIGSGVGSIAGGFISESLGGFLLLVL